VPSAQTFFKDVKASPERFYIIHYSSQSLYDAEAGAHSPRITSIVVRHYVTGQTVSFATHTTAEYFGIPPDEVEGRYNDVERELLTKFYEFVRDRRVQYWIHWNMRSVVFGFEHLEHRYRLLTGHDAPSIPVEVRINLSDVLKNRYGADYAPHPQMPKLMALNGGPPQGVMSGKEEAAAFETRDFIRMNASTIAKVGWFSHVLTLARQGQLKTAGSGILNALDRMLETRQARIILAICAIVGEPRRVCRRLFRLSHAAIAGWSSVA
jgi:hypothetical protein